VIWRIGNSDTYIMASVHIMDSPPLAFSVRGEQAYATVKRVAFETDITMAPDIARYCLPATNTLGQSLTPSLLKASRQKAQEAGVAWEQVERVQPWLAGLTIMMHLVARQGITAADGVDTQLLKRATSDRLQITYLEPQDESLKAFASASASEQIGFLTFVVEDTETCLAQARTMVSALRHGLEKPLDEILDHRLTNAPKMFDALVSQRNKTWMSHIQGLMLDKVPTLVCVGAFHCVGSGSLPARLTQLGYEVSRID
jgi:uncharacterized protein